MRGLHSSRGWNQGRCLSSPLGEVLLLRTGFLPALLHHEDAIDLNRNRLRACRRFPSEHAILFLYDRARQKLYFVWMSRVQVYEESG